MKIQDLSAYEIIKEQKLEDLNSKGYLLRHKKSGARISVISNDDENKVFQKEIENNQLWKNELSFKMNSLLPLFVQTETSKFDHFLVYNVTKNEYNNYPTDGKYELIFIAYDYDLNRLLILDDYKVNIN